MSYTENIFKYIEDHEKELISFAQKLIQIPSISGHEGRDVAKIILEELVKLGLDAELVEAEENRPNILARFQGTDEKPCLLVYMHHYDHVPPGNLKDWKHGPYSGNIADGLLWGRGSMKADSAAWLWAFKALKDSGLKLKGNIIFTCVCDEELGGSKGFKYLIDKGYCDDADFMIMGGGGDGKTITLACNQRAIFKITLTGKIAHTGDNQNGINAILKAAKLISKLQELAEEVNARTYQYDIPELTSIVNARFSINIIYSGWGADTVYDGVLSVNTVPDICVIELDRRIMPSETIEQAMYEINEVINELSEEDTELKAVVTIDEQYGIPLSISQSDSAVAKALFKVIPIAVGMKPSFNAISASSDYANFTERTIKPAVAYGFLRHPLGQEPHHLNEAIFVDDIVKSAKVYALALAEIIGTE